MEEAQNKKLSYEELEKVAANLAAQLEKAKQIISTTSTTIAFKRADYLFEVLKYADRFGEDFISQCVTELKEFLERPSSEETTE